MRSLASADTERVIQKLGIESSSLEAFAVDVHEPISFSWHDHSRHQLVYAFEGALAIEAEQRRYLVPPQRAIWIPAGVRHRTTHGFAINKKPCRAHTASLYFSSTLAQTRDTSVLNCPTLLRNMIEYSLAWGPSHHPTPASKAFFRAIAALCMEWIDQPSPAFWLPVSSNKEIQKVLDCIQTDLRGADEASAAQACCMSPRNFRRHFSRSTGLTWREYISRARLFYAADQLTGTADAIEEIAWQCNYDSRSAFAKAFLEFTGQTPAEYRRGRLSTSLSLE